MGSKHLDFTRVRSRMGFVLDSDGETGISWCGLLPRMSFP